MTPPPPSSDHCFLYLFWSDILVIELSFPFWRVMHICCYLVPIYYFPVYSWPPFLWCVEVLLLCWKCSFFVAVFLMELQRWPLMEGDIWWKTTFDERWPLMNDNLWLRTTFNGSQHLMEDNIWRKTPFDGRWPLMVDKLSCKTPFHRRQPFKEVNIWWLLMEGNL